ncbi:hypothetical protein D9M73_130410 [compost metagenome]
MVGRLAGGVAPAQINREPRRDLEADLAEHRERALGVAPLQCILPGGGAERLPGTGRVDHELVGRQPEIGIPQPERADQPGEPLVIG